MKNTRTVAEQILYPYQRNIGGHGVYEHEDIFAAMEEYAQQACEDLRKRISDNAYLSRYDIHGRVISKGFTGFTYDAGQRVELDKQSILDVEIILP